MAAGQEFYLVAAATSDKDESKSADGFLQRFQTRPAGSFHGVGVFKLDVPAGEKSLNFGSFDSLIKLTEDLHKFDGQIDSMVHRLERQLLELDPATQFTVVSQRQEKSFLQYFKDWSWDEAKYPRHRTIQDNMTLLMKAVNQFDDETKSKTQQFNDLKTTKNTIAFKENPLLTGKDLVDVLTPEACPDSANDFVYSEYLDTVVFILPKGADKDFLKDYERYCENVVPGSAKQFTAHRDKDGNQLWRVIVFKSAAEAFKKALRDKRFLVRDFVYSSDAHTKLVEQREYVAKQSDQAMSMLKSLYKAAWSDTMVAWMHVKAARIFVESVLRFGMPPNFASFVVPPGSNPVKTRQAIEYTLGGGNSGIPAGADDEEEVYSYVSLSMMPFLSR